MTVLICSEPACPEVATYRGRCALHARENRRDPSDRRGGRWQAIVVRVVRRDRGVCWICGEPGANSVDHVVRRRDGGSDRLSNLRAAHLTCNRERG